MPRRFRKKPVEIEAVQLTWQNWSEVCDFADVGRLEDGRPQGGYLNDDGGITPEHPGEDAKIALSIPTLEGLMVASENDWIIRGVQGELYPCKPDIFKATYEPVLSTETVAA